MIILTPNLKAVADFAAVESSGRSNLENVLIEKRDDAITRLVATDGRALIQVDSARRIDHGELPVIPGFDASVKNHSDASSNGASSARIPAKSYRQAFKSMPGKTKHMPALHCLQIAIEADQVVLASTNLDKHAVMSVKTSDDIFPQYKLSIPEKAPVLTVTFNAAMLASALNSIDAIIAPERGKITACTLEFTGNNSPVKITAQNEHEKVVAVVMPWIDKKACEDAQAIKGEP